MAGRRPELKKKIDADRVSEFVSSLISEDMHAKRVQSLASGVIGVVHSASLCIHAIGRGLAAVRGLVDKHAVKQIDRLVGNRGIRMKELFPSWISYLLADRTKIRVNMDWTEFDGDDHSMLVCSLQSSHGRSAPLIWRTVIKSQLKNRRNSIEDELLQQLRECIPNSVHTTLVADRGFGDQKRYEQLTELGFFYIVRFREGIRVESNDGEVLNAGDWVGRSGRMKTLKNATVTGNSYPVQMVVCVKERGMKDAWCLAVSDPTLKGSEAKNLYGRRFTIEETFRDMKDLRYGMGMSWTTIGRTDRRDRLFFIAAMAHALLTLLGQAGEDAGLDRLLKTNTSKKRTLSLLRQGLIWYDRIQTMPEERLEKLMSHFSKVVANHSVFSQVFGVL